MDCRTSRGNFAILQPNGQSTPSSPSWTLIRVLPSLYFFYLLHITKQTSFFKSRLYPSAALFTSTKSINKSVAVRHIPQMTPSPSRLFLLLFLFYFIQSVHTAPKDQWRTRSIYQVMIDRFARTDGNTSFPCNVTARIYCGGTWKGLRNNLDYIQGMGFDAIWISPISQNIQGMTGDGEGYTGYWVTDMTSLNSHFGTSDDLIALSNEVHSRGLQIPVRW